ncbi:MAG: zinc ribbon domain-containing protein [Methanobrevibacter sp.]|nr:zinc ribbon domain-containing protein [Methanobrevibacter sp.]
MFCEKCGAEVNEEDRFCSNCGGEIKPIENNICRKCGAEVNEDDKFCSSCGEKVGSNESSNQPSGLINCPDCGNPVSRKAKACPNCGCPVVSMTPDGVVRIKLSNLINTMTKQGVSIKDENGQVLWRGNAGQIAEIYFERQTQITIKYHTAANAWGGSCKGVVDPSKGTKYATTVRRGFLGTNIELQRVDILDSDF